MKKIMSSYTGCAVKPEVQVTSGAFKFVLPNQNTATPIEINPNSVLDEREKTVFAVLSDHKLHPRAEIEKALGVSTSTVNRLLRKMVAAGKVKVTGTTKNALYQSTNYGGQNHD